MSGNKQQHLVGGAALLFVALFAFYFTWHHDAGTLAEIGPGGPPRVFAAFLAILGLFEMALCLKREEKSEAPQWQFAFSPRPVFAVLGAIVLFGLLVQPLGILGAAPILLILAGFAAADVNWREYAPYIIALPLFCAGLFRFALGLPIPLAPWLFGY